jgi:hypothetical protein
MREMIQERIGRINESAEGEVDEKTPAPPDAPPQSASPAPGNA